MKRCSFLQKRDRLSYLPDPLRSHIVSFLPMKDAIRTSILSSRWEHISSTLSNMDFNEFEFLSRGKERIGDFIDEMISRHDGSDVPQFSLMINFAYILPRRVNAWVSFAVRHNVQEFSLVDLGEKIEKLPLRFFTCKTLTVLKLCRVNIKWPANVNFPRLKSLTLTAAHFHDENTIGKLVSSLSCPVLEDLTLDVCSVCAKTLSISLPTLKCFKFEDNSDVNYIVSSTLVELECRCYGPENVSIEDLSSILTAKFDFLREFDSDYIVKNSQYNYSSKILMGMCNVVRLYLLNGFIEILYGDRDLLARCLSTSICSLEFLFIELFPTRMHVQVTMLLLRIYPNLQTLDIHVEKCRDISTFAETVKMEEYWQLTDSPGEILKGLKTVHFREFDGSECELDLIRYLLENAGCLEEMDIGYTTMDIDPLDVETQARIGETLSTFTQLSPNVTVSLS